MAGPLAGVRVVDCSAVLSGPLATMLLADQGAEVIKVEAPGLGDVLRLSPFSRGGLGAFFANGNRGKRAITLDLRQPRGRALLLDHREWTPDTKQEPAGSEATPGRGQPPGRKSPSRRPATDGPVTLRREAAYWILATADRTNSLKDTKGLHYLALLLRDPGREFHVLDLVQDAGFSERGPDKGPRPGDSGLEVLDPGAKAAYKHRLTELREELDEAEQFNDRGRAERSGADLTRP